MITVKFFANLKKMAGAEEVKLDIGDKATMDGFIGFISKHYPEIGNLLKEKRLLVSINQEVADTSTVINKGDEVALLPPFSGGV